MTRRERGPATSGRVAPGQTWYPYPPRPQVGPYAGGRSPSDAQERRRRGMLVVVE
jgi:hypothetical protein